MRLRCLIGRIDFLAYNSDGLLLPNASQALHDQTAVATTETLPGRQMDAPLLLAVLCQTLLLTIHIDLALPRLSLNRARVRESEINGRPKPPLDFKLTYVEQIVGSQFLTVAGAA